MKRVLIAYGKNNLPTALRDVLRDRYEVHICETGEEALALLERLRPDALVVAIYLYGIKGLELLETTRYKPPVVIALTDLVTEELICRAAAAGVSELMRIPVRLGYLADRLDTLLEETEKIPAPGV